MKKISKIYQAIANFIRSSVKFVTYDVWHLSSEKLSHRDAFLARQLKVIIIAVRSFAEDKISMRASALTYYTLMSIIPIAALVFAIARGFNFDNQLRTYLIGNFSEQKEVVEWMLNFVDSTIKNTKNGIIAGIGIVVLLWACMRMLIMIEESLNHVWNVKNPRSWKNRVTNYMSVIILAPVFLILSSSVSLTVNHHMNGLISTYSFFNNISPALHFLYKCIPFVAVWALFAILYKFMPNTRVRWSHAMLAAIISGTIFQLFFNLYLYFQFALARYSAIYGTFAAIPLFLIWAHISWSIVLIGAELAFAYQNIDNYEREKESEQTSFMQRKAVALLVARLVAQNFKDGNLPLEVPEISEKLLLPTRIVRVIVDDLVDAQIFSEVISSDDDKEYAYQPAFDVNAMTISEVLLRLEMVGRSDFITNDNVDFACIKEILSRIDSEIQHSKNNKLLIDI